MVISQRMNPLHQTLRCLCTVQCTVKNTVNFAVKYTEQCYEQYSSQYNAYAQDARKEKLLWEYVSYASQIHTTCVPLGIGHPSQPMLSIVYNVVYTIVYSTVYTVQYSGK